MNELFLNDAGDGLSRKVAISRSGPVRVAAIHDEEWIEGEPLAGRDGFIRSLPTGLPADIFAFARPIPECEPCYPFHFEWDNVAVASLANGFDRWWNGLPQETRKNVRRSQRRGVAVERVPFGDALIRGIGDIYNETPIRQGRKFRHYGKSLDQVKAENATYLDRSEFIGAFFNGELIGFTKFVMVNNVARIMQIVSRADQTDKRPTNALLAKAVEICCDKPASHLVYGKYVYGKKENSPVTEFKKRNGFERLSFPRYYVPLTRLGSYALRWGLHRGLAHFMPEAVTNLFLTARAVVYRRRFGVPERISKTVDPGKNLAAGHSRTAI